MRQRIVVLTGAGISAESGLKTFRDSDGLWEGYKIEEVATPHAWARNPEVVQRFYNERRKAVLAAEPNPAHYALVSLEAHAEVTIITQNIDDLHERAGSTNVIHLHGEILKAQSSLDPSLVYPIEGWELTSEQRCELGAPLRPHIVWFGEAVPKIEEAAYLTSLADIFIVIGTSLAVYPAAGLIDLVPVEKRTFLVDRRIPDIAATRVGLTAIEKPASIAVPELVTELIRELESKQHKPKLGGS